MKTKWVIFSVLFLQGVSGFANQGSESDETISVFSACAVPRVDGQKVPFPLRDANTKFDLAENEIYLLNGYFVATPSGVLVFQVDFNTQPWMRTQSRVSNPYFLLDKRSRVVIKGPTGLVQVAVTARRDQSHRIILDPFLDPMPFRR